MNKRMSTLCTFSSLTAPFLMAYNTTDHVYYLKQHAEIKDELTEQQLASFLQDVLEGRAKVSSVICGQVMERKKKELVISCAYIKLWMHFGSHKKLVF